MKERQCPNTPFLYLTVLFHAEFFRRILFLKLKFSFLLIPAFALKLGCFLYFAMVFKTGSFMLFVSHRISPLTVMLRFLTILVKKSLNTSAILPLSSEIASFSSINVTFTGSLHLLQGYGFTIFQKFTVFCYH